MKLENALTRCFSRDWKYRKPNPKERHMWKRIGNRRARRAAKRELRGQQAGIKPVSGWDVV